MVPFWDLSDHINDLTSKKIPLTAPHSFLLTKSLLYPIILSLKEEFFKLLHFLREGA